MAENTCASIRVNLHNFLINQNGNTYVYYLEAAGFTPKYKTMSELSMNNDDIYASMPELVSAVFPNAKYCPVSKTVTVDGTVFDLKNKVREKRNYDLRAHATCYVFQGDGLCMLYDILLLTARLCVKAVCQ